MIPLSAKNDQPNKLINEHSPYLLQHAYNPVHWFPWGDEAFAKAKAEDKPIFLSIGYSTCHWCHVMAHESFEDQSVAELLNSNFISIKVDKEERPDIDGVYMRVCQALTGSGGWPTSIFITADKTPFYAGTYFPKQSFINLLNLISQTWTMDRKSLLVTGDKLKAAIAESAKSQHSPDSAPIDAATEIFRNTFDPQYGGFGRAPKFPSPHNLMFLMDTAPDMAEKTLRQMYAGGIFDHIGGGFSRYSTDRFWLAPHFEKMLYDNALLVMAYLLCYEKTGNPLYKTVTEKVLAYLEREMHDTNGGFFAAQDADSEGIEGKYYLFTVDELTELLGQEQANLFCKYFDITDQGNFEGKNIPNLIDAPQPTADIEHLLPIVYEYRKSRTSLHTDKKILTAWNGLTAAAYAMAARILKDHHYLHLAKETIDFIEQQLTDGNAIFVSITEGNRSGLGFLDDYAFYIFALLNIYQATLETAYLNRASELTKKAISSFWDKENGGFFFSGTENEQMISRPKESYDGAIPSGNSVMAYNLSRLEFLTGDAQFAQILQQQQSFMNTEASIYPAGFSFYLYSVLPTKNIVCVPQNNDDLQKLNLKTNWICRITDSPDYPMINNRTTYYVCENHACHPPTNELL